MLSSRLDFRMLQDRLQLRAEIQIVAAAVDVQRLDAHAVARQHQALFATRVHSATANMPRKPAKAVRVPLQKGVQNRFRVAVRLEAVPERFQFLPQLQVVINFAVEGDDGVAIG